MRFVVVILLWINVFNILYAKQFEAENIRPYVYPENQTKSPVNFTYMSDGLTYLMLSEDGKTILQYDTEKAIVIDTIFDINKTRETSINNISGFILSPEGSKLLVYNNVSPIYRRSYNATYYVYEIKRKILRPLSKQYQKQRAPIFSPDGRMVAFVASNNIYIKKIDYDSEVAVTTDGKFNSIINGVPDWTYEEEFMVTSSMVWSPDNLTLCYVKYNEEKVHSYSFPMYGGICQKNKNAELYPIAYEYKYPKAGSENPVVTVYSYDIETRKTKNIQLNKDVEYIPRICYANSANSVVITTLNRNQNKYELYLTNPKTTLVKCIYKDISKTWIDEICYNNVKFYNDFFVVSSAKSGYNHLYKYSYSGIELEQITSGSYDVIDYYGCDEKGNHYFQSTKSGAINRVVSKIDNKGNTIDLSQDKGCASASFSPMMNYYILGYSNAHVAPIYTLFSSLKNKKIRVVVENETEQSKYINTPKREFFSFFKDGIEFNGYMIKPISFDANNKYPVIMTQYNGPSSQSVLNKWSIDWENYYAMQGYIVVCVDGRGTAGRGQNFKGIVYKKLGYYETEDQISAVKYMQSQSYVDSSRIGVYGWSYGGYETLMLIAHEDAPYKAAVAVAPVTDWRYYDTAYTERFMQTPQENEDGYISSSALNRINNVKCNLLIMSGTADDNVHLSNTMEYVSQLINGGKYCDMFLFPNMNHSINKCDTRVIVYAKMLDYFNKNLKD